MLEAPMIRWKLTGLAITSMLALGGCTYTDWRDSFSDLDHAQMNAAVQAALETRQTGESGNWANPASGHRGTVTPTRTWVADDGRDCRDYQQTVTVGDVTRVGYGSACRAANGVWVDRRSPRYVVAGARPYHYRPHRFYFGPGYGHHYGRRHYGFGHHRFFGPYPLHAYRYGYPYYWY
jgi:surface antigen